MVTNSLDNTDRWYYPTSVSTQTLRPLSTLAGTGLEPRSHGLRNKIRRGEEEPQGISKTYSLKFLFYEGVPRPSAYSTLPNKLLLLPVWLTALTPGIPPIRGKLRCKNLLSLPALPISAFLCRFLELTGQFVRTQTCPPTNERVSLRLRDLSPL